jgi:hypothetical protein
MFFFKVLFQENHIEFTFKWHHVVQFRQTPPVVVLQGEIQSVVIRQVIVSLP